MTHYWHVFWMRFHNRVGRFWHRRGNSVRAREHAHKAEQHLLRLIFN